MERTQEFINQVQHMKKTTEKFINSLQSGKDSNSIFYDMTAEQNDIRKAYTTKYHDHKKLYEEYGIN